MPTSLRAIALVERMIDLRNGAISARLAPASGGRIASLAHEVHGEILVPMDQASFEPEFWPKAGAYPLIPFHNRVRDGRFSWKGAHYQLPLHPSEPHALHGFGSRRAWTAKDVQESSATLELQHEADTYWPWSLCAQQHIVLEADGLALKLSVTNLSDSVMPAGLGWHPYFVKAREIEDDAELSWSIGEDMIPTGESTRDRTCGATQYLSNWRKVIVTLLNGMRLAMTSGPLLSHLVIHDVAPEYSCVEPTSHLANALSAVPEHAGDRLVPLAPNETLTVGLKLQIL